MKKQLFASALLLMALIAGAQSPRVSLYEEFTGETCPPCAATNPGLNTLLLSASNATRIVAIKWQVPIPSVPSNTWSLYKTNKTEIDWRYKSTANGGYGYNPAVTYAPLGKIDGQSQAVFGATGSSVDHPANLTNAIIATAASYSSAFNIIMTRDVITNTSTAAAVNVTIQATAPYTTNSSLVFRNVLVERVINFSVQPGTNGEKDFNDAARISYPTLQAGTSLPATWTVGQVYTFSMNCVFPSHINSKTQIEFVGFIQNEGTQKVEQTTRTDLPHPTFDAAAAPVSPGMVCNTANTLAPTVSIYNNGQTPITSATITPYIDGVAKNTTTWTGNIQPGYSAIVNLNAFTSSTVSGLRTFSYSIASSSGTDNNLSNNGAQAKFYEVYSYQGTPIAEGFATTGWPYSGWMLNNSNGGAATWTFQTGVEAYALSSGNCLKYPFFKNTVLNDKDEFMLPPLDLSGPFTPTMSFDLAHVLKATNSSDKLEVMASTDCGNTWTTVWTGTGSDLAVNQVPVTTEYLVPAAEDWMPVTSYLAGYNNANVLVKFVATNKNGNNLYIDNINIGSNSIPDGLINNSPSKVDVSVYPNPSNGLANVRVNSVISQNAKLTVTNAMGQLVLQKQLKLNTGTNNTMVDLSQLADGIYTVSIDAESGKSVSKLCIGK